MSKGARILVIDDEKSIRKLLEISLGAEGYEVIPAKTGKEGLQEAANHNPDVIILDLGLPDMQGMDVLKKLKSRATTPVIILTARAGDADREMARDVKADDYITKPFEPSELLTKIKKFLKEE